MVERPAVFNLLSYLHQEIFPLIALRNDPEGNMTTLRFGPKSMIHDIGMNFHKVSTLFSLIIYPT